MADKQTRDEFLKLQKSGDCSSLPVREKDFEDEHEFQDACVRKYKVCQGSFVTKPRNILAQWHVKAHPQSAKSLALLNGQVVQNN